MGNKKLKPAEKVTCGTDSSASVGYNPTRYSVLDSHLADVFHCLKHIKDPITKYNPEENEVVFLKGIIRRQIEQANHALAIIIPYLKGEKPTGL